jgi:hypothetical protein
MTHDPDCATQVGFIPFRPFRRVNGKLVVTSYMGWRKIFTANYRVTEAVVRLLPFPEITKGELVYAMGKTDGVYKFWHRTKFEPLFWPIDKETEHPAFHDCDGCPSFSHKTTMYVVENYPEKMHLFELLTADIVYEEFELMRDKLTNVKWL